jgi:hypothetical protein
MKKNNYYPRINSMWRSKIIPELILEVCDIVSLPGNDEVLVADIHKPEQVLGIIHLEDLLRFYTRVF